MNEKLIVVGVAVHFWASFFGLFGVHEMILFFIRNELTSFMQATVMETYWQRLWALLQSHDAKARLAGRAIEVVLSLNIFAKKQMQ
jgi:hypothetical protein